MALYLGATSLNINIKCIYMYIKRLYTYIKKIYTHTWTLTYTQFFKSLGEAPTSVLAAWSHSLAVMSLNILHIYTHTYKIYVYIEMD